MLQLYKLFPSGTHPFSFTRQTNEARDGFMRFHLLAKIVVFHPSNDHFRVMQCYVTRWGAVMMKYLAAGRAG